MDFSKIPFAKCDRIDVVKFFHYQKIDMCRIIKISRSSAAGIVIDNLSALLMPLLSLTLSSSIFKIEEL